MIIKIICIHCGSDETLPCADGIHRCVECFDEHYLGRKPKEIGRQK
jgi:hypothetical protein